MCENIFLTKLLVEIKHNFLKDFTFRMKIFIKFNIPTEYEYFLTYFNT